MAEGGGRSDGSDKARDEFFSEAQELVDSLGRDLLELDDALKNGRPDVELVNDVFRGVHTLKGLSALFGVTRMAGLSHELEDVLDDLRLGRLTLTPELLDLLFRAVSLYTRVLAAEKGEAEEPSAEVEQLLVALGQTSQRPAGGGAAVVAQYDLDPSLLGVLTEYEEHRLRSNIQQGFGLFRIRVRFALSTIDSALDALKASARPHGEIITYLPTGAGADVDTIELEILMAARVSLEVLRGAIQGPNVSIEEVRRRTGPSGRPSAPNTDPPAGPVSQAPAPDALSAVGAALAESGAAVAPNERIRGRDGGPSVAPAGPVRATPRGHVAEMSLRSVSQTVRVDIRKLDRLMTIVGELAIVKTAIARLSDRARARSMDPRELATDLQRLHRSFDRHLAQMQAGILEVRMVPLGQVFDKLARVVRQISRELGKEVNLVVTGAETEIDKLIVEELSDPLMHMIRNAIDHAIEVRAERLRVGKPSIGTIALNAFQKGNHVVIEVEDDGAGMDPESIIGSAIRRGIISAEEAKELSPREVLGLVFMPGFTTRDVPTDMSGRGVGLDVVKTNIAKLGGVVDVTSELGIGTKITITLPITLAIINVLLVEISGRLFAMPLANVDEAIVLDATQLRTVDSREMLTVRGRSLPICRLVRHFGLPPLRRAREFVVIAQVASRRLGFVVDELVGQRDIVIKPLGKSLKKVRGFAGATELGDQRVALVLDAAALIEEVLSAAEARFLVAVEADGRRQAAVRRA
jgi:two-component system chemotaxis sensor kinase CheA